MYELRSLVGDIMFVWCHTVYNLQTRKKEGHSLLPSHLTADTCVVQLYYELEL